MLYTYQIEETPNGAYMIVRHEMNPRRPAFPVFTVMDSETARKIQAMLTRETNDMSADSRNQCADDIRRMMFEKLQALPCVAKWQDPTRVSITQVLDEVARLLESAKE